MISTLLMIASFTEPDDRAVGGSPLSQLWGGGARVRAHLSDRVLVDRLLAGVRDSFRVFHDLAIVPVCLSALLVDVDLDQAALLEHRYELGHLGVCGTWSSWASLRRACRGTCMDPPTVFHPYPFLVTVAGGLFIRVLESTLRRDRHPPSIS